MNEITRVGVKDFKTNLSRHLNKGEPITITNNGKAVGIYLPIEDDSDRNLERLLEDADKVLKGLRK